jgi:PHD/YefM family antitoxin component YafN of YafNO toxin-antitoxin module
MKTYNSTNFRRNMNKVFNECEGSSDPVLITTRKDGRDEPQQMVIISKAQYDIMQEQVKGVSDE